jgi:3-(3-hydroxy-phenyl)propionate hydroxylase
LATETVAGAYIVSAEGARSIVRKELDIEFEGFTYWISCSTSRSPYDFRRHAMPSATTFRS